MFAPPLTGNSRRRLRVKADPGRWGARPPEVRAGADRTQAEWPLVARGSPTSDHAPIADALIEMEVKRPDEGG